MKFLEATCLSLAALLAPIQTVILTTLVLIAVDLVTGILAARKRGERIKSSGLRRTCTKTAVYLTAIIVGFLVEKYMLGDFLAVSKLVSGVISVVEMKSLMENLDQLNGEPIFKSIIKRLGSVNDQFADDAVPKKDDDKPN